MGLTDPHELLIPNQDPNLHTDRSTAIMEVAKCSSDFTVQCLLWDPEVTGEAAEWRFDMS